MSEQDDFVLCVELPFFEGEKTGVLRLADRYTRTPDGREFLPLLVENVIFERRADVQNGGMVASFGELVFFNDEPLGLDFSEGDLAKFARVFEGQQATFYRAKNGDLEPLAVARIERITPQGGHKFVVSFRDSLAELNKAIPLQKIKVADGKTSNNKAHAPVLFGEVFNVTPVLVDAGKHLYKLHDGALKQIFEVRDDGAPVSFVADLANGTFTLEQSPFGQITADAASETDNARTVFLDIFRRTNFEAPADFAANLQNLPRLGVYIKDPTNALELLQNIAQSCNLLFSVGVDGAPVLLPLFDYSAPLAVDCAGASFEMIGSMPPVALSFVIQYAKNYTTSGKLAGGVAPDSVALFEQNAQTITAKSPELRQKTRRFDAPITRESFLISNIAAAHVVFERFRFLSKSAFDFRLTLHNANDADIKLIRVGGAIQSKLHMPYLVESMAWNLSTNRVVLGLKYFFMKDYNAKNDMPKGLKTPINPELDKHAALKRLYATEPRMLPKNSPINNTDKPDTQTPAAPRVDVDNLAQAAARLVLESNSEAARYFAGARLVFHLPNGETIEASLNESNEG